MILTCPNCSARYRVADESVPASGRKVRCAKCGHIWHQSPPVAADFPDTDSPDADLRTHLAAQSPMAATHDEEDRSALLEMAMLGVGWAGLALILLLLGWAGYNYRHVVMESWPQSASVYSALGLAHAHGGLEISLAPLKKSIDHGHTVLEIRGEVKNITDHALTVPQLRAHFLDAAGSELARWSVESEALTLQPGEATRFATKFHNPPQAARQFEIRFAGAA